MSFLSGEFAVFFPVVCLMYFACPYRWRWLVLLPASYLFYMSWRPWYLTLILFSTAVDYVVALRLARARRVFVRRALLGVSLAANLGMLFFFKYHNWFARSINDVADERLIPLLDVLLPVGISFYTFQTLAYTIEVYRGRQPAERHAGYFATYVAFFPQLVAGPIERPSHPLPQLKQRVDFDYLRVTNGLKLIAWGLFKKAVVADRLATLVDPVYAAPEAHASLVFLSTLAFGAQIYCDFSGYSDIAIGAASVMGISLMKNFRAPYRAVSLQDFWRRWHISLSTWFRDYLYKPLLSKGRQRKQDALLAAFVVFVASGIWHGAAWTFLIWGALHGAMYAIGRLTSEHRAALMQRIFAERYRTLRHAAAIASTFILVHLAWVLFRADSIPAAQRILALMPSGLVGLFDFTHLSSDLAAIGWGWFEVSASLFGVGMVFLVHQIEGRHDSARLWLSARPWAVRWGVYVGIIWSFLLLGVFDRQEFIYFQF
jgi:D-alanyl-lipoteichoic acid acyltransferase DltB (MBOAT superfamily)